ncbi:Two-component system sensor histidine kinase/response regulator hybrid [hydrothermal vent metagenome]|uniref:Two-component system sensor histidine kinase/response regulator hybrid n=1 Tax=hydrothermal vent metagenome TaxID=652676 RepID=A0A3B1CZL0_9ZZZZ
MKDEDKPKEQLVDELQEMRWRIDELEDSECRCRRAEEKLHRVNRALKVLSECNQIIVRVRDEPALLSEICKVFVDVGGYCLAWVGFTDRDEEKTVRLMAQAGYEEGYIETLNITWADTDRGRGPTGTAIRTGKVSINRDVLSNPDYALWRLEAIKRGYQSSIALPLIDDNRTLGAINIYAPEPDAFDSEEVRLLTEMANDLAYGITVLRMRAEHRRSEEEQVRLRRRLEILWNIARMADADYQTLCDHVLVEITAMTQSPYAFYAFLNEAETVMKIYAFSEGVIKDCRIEDRPIEYPLVDAGLIGDAVRFRRTLIINDYRSCPGKKGVPWGHVPLTRALIVPVFSHGRVVALAGVADKPTDYTEDDARQVESFATNVQVIMDRRHAEEEKGKIQAQLLQAQKMEAVGTLAGGVAHDFNNLLTAIRGYVDLVMMKVDESETFYRYLKQIRNASVRAADLTRQLLLFSRKQPMEFIHLNINRTIDDLLLMLNRLIGEDIVIRTNLEPDIWMVRADTGSIEQVIMNLAGNARDAMPNGGSLTIRTENVLLDEEQSNVILEARPGKFVCLSVEDTGAGMNKKTIQHIFEPFFTTKEAGKGTGLGLSVVYGIVKQHEGWINVSSKQDRGSMFRIYLSASSVKPEDEKGKPIPVHKLQGSGERILLVEDAEGVRGFASEVLRGSGYSVTEASNVQEALEIFEREKGDFHLLLSDVVLPDKSGLYLVDRLLSYKPELRVLLSSGYTDQKSQWRLIQEREFRFLQKPYALADLLQAVKEVIEKN